MNNAEPEWPVPTTSTEEKQYNKELAANAKAKAKALANAQAKERADADSRLVFPFGTFKYGNSYVKYKAAKCSVTLYVGKSAVHVVKSDKSFWFAEIPLGYNKPHGK